MKLKFTALVLTLCMIVVMVVPLSVNAETKHNVDGDVVVDVTDYGADRTGVTDSAVAIQKAIVKAKELSDQGQNVIISFPKGRYDIYPDYSSVRELYVSNTVGVQGWKDKTIGILLENIDNVTVDGNGSLFMFHGKMTPFAAIDCQNVTFQNFNVDFQVHTVIDLTVGLVSGNSVSVFVPENNNYEINGKTINWLSDVSPYTGERYWTLQQNNINYFQIHDKISERTWRGGNDLFSNVKSIQDLGDHKIKITYNSLPNIDSAYCYQMRNTTRDHPGAFIWKCTDVNLRNLDIQFLHGFGMVFQTSTNLTLDDVDFETDRRTGTTSASSADFIQMSGCKGLIDIGNCTFANPHDDPINVHGTFLQVTSINRNSNQITVQFMHHETAGFPNFFIGDEIEFIAKSNMLSIDGYKAKVIAVDGPDGMGGTSSTGSLNQITLTLDSDIPSEVTANRYVVENITYTPSVNIHDNIFKKTPTRGILCTTRQKVVINNNYFTGMEMACIYISDDSNSWYESGATKDVEIKNNIFTKCGAQAILIEPTAYSSKQVHSNMTIEGNTFLMSGTQVLNATSVENLIFKNNNIYRLDPNITINATATKTSLSIGESAAISTNATGSSLSTEAYRLTACKNVTFEGNTYDGGINAKVVSLNTTGITVTNDAALITSQNNITDPKGTICYESSDDNVIRVSSYGTVRAVGSGTATVSVYSIAGGKKCGEQKIEFTVSDLGLADNITIESQDSSLWNIAGKDRICAQTAKGGTFKEQVAKNVFTVPIDENTDDVTVTLKIEGKAQKDWEDVGLYLYQDENNYVAIQRKFRETYAVLGMVNEINQSANEQLDATEGTIYSNDIYFKLVKKGSVVTAYFSDDGRNWHQFKNPVINSTLGRGMKVAFGAMNNGNSEGSSFIFTDLYINDKHVPLTKKITSLLELADGITIDNPNINWSIEGKDRIYAKASNGGIFQEQTPANWFKIPVGNDTTEVTLKIEGRTKKSWDDVGLYLGKDADNYVSIQRKNRGNNREVLGLVNEMNRVVAGNGGEQLENGTSILSRSDYEHIYFKLAREGNIVTAYYSADGNTWTQYGSAVKNTTFATADQLYVAFGAMNNDRETDSSFIFTELTVNKKPVPLTLELLLH